MARKAEVSQCMVCDRWRSDILLITIKATVQGQFMIALALACRDCIVAGVAKVPFGRVFPGIPEDQIVVQ